MTQSFQPFLIANERVGIERDIEPFLLPNDAYVDLEDCYLWRGRIKRRLGFDLLGRLQRKIGTTNGGGGAVIILPNIPISAGLSAFKVGTTTYQDDGTAANPTTLLVGGTAPQGTATLDRVTGTLTIVGGPALTDIIYIPGLPVMGLAQLESRTVNIFTLIAFDTSFAYIFTSSFTDKSTYKTTGNPLFWTGQNFNLFWTYMWADALWATNNIRGFQNVETTLTAGQGDGIRWLDSDQSGWVNFLPNVDGTNFLMGALMIVPYKGRLVMLNTTEGTAIGAFNNFFQRARWSQYGTPFVGTVPTNYAGGTDATAWRSDIPGKGGFNDAPTNEQIISCEFVKDVLVVYFERSTYQLQYTGDPALTFIWVRINTELGSQSTFSVVPFDRVCMAIAEVGIHACDTVNVERIDQKIPDEVFNIQNLTQGRQRVYGIRDYFNQLVYWSIPYLGYDSEIGSPDGLNITFPNKILVYNYIDQSFAFFNDSFTCFGYFQNSVNNKLWQDATDPWEESDFLWNSPLLQNNFVDVIGGNQQGFVEILAQNMGNDDSLFISNIVLTGTTVTITSENHNLEPGMFVNITSATGITGLAGTIYKVLTVPTANTFTIITDIAASGTFIGPGTITVVNNISVESKRFNPFLNAGQKVRLGFIDFYVDKTTDGAFTVNIYIDDDSSTPINVQPGNVGSQTVNTFPETTYAASPQTDLPVSKLWKRYFVQDISQFFQIQITLSDDQMTDPDIVNSDIVVHGMILWFATSGRITNS